MSVERERRMTEGEGERKMGTQTKSKRRFSSSGKWKGWLRKKKAREDQTVRSLCWCDEGPALGWSGDGEQSVHCGHGWTTQPLHKCPFLRRGKEMLRFTVTTSRLYNVNVKLHWGVPWKEPSPPICHTRTLALFMFQGIPLTQQSRHVFSLYWEVETEIVRPIDQTWNWWRSDIKHSNQMGKAASERSVRQWWKSPSKFHLLSPPPPASELFCRHLEEVLL